MFNYSLPAIVGDRIPSLRLLRPYVGGVLDCKIPRNGGDTERINAPLSPPPAYSLGHAGGHSRFAEWSRPAVTVLERDRGINWKYANQGITLLNQAYQESNAFASDDDKSVSTVLMRQLYLHGMAYLLQGIPAELSRDECLSLRAAIPAHLISLDHDPDACAPITLPERTAAFDQISARPPSTLQRITASIILQAFILTQCLLPYIKLFLGHVYRWERKHKVTERVLNTGIKSLNQLTGRSVKLSQSVCQMNDGKVGQAINNLALWWVQGVAGGIRQGISEGVGMIENDRTRITVDLVGKTD